MVFTAPGWAGQLPPIPDNLSLTEFILTEQHGRVPLDKSNDPFTCALTGKTYSSGEVVDRVDLISRALNARLNWDPRIGSEWNKVLAIFTLNSIDTLPVVWAAHHLGGVVTLANAAYSVAELVHQLKDSKATVLFTCLSLLPTAREAAAKANISENQIFLLDVPIPGPPAGYRSASQLVEEGKQYPPVRKADWGAGEGARRTAFLCYSSGTSGLPKGVMISHYNVIANTLQMTTFEQSYRDKLAPPGSEIALGLLPQSHIYSLVVICHAGWYRGDQTIILPKYTFASYMAAIQDFKISSLFLVPPIIIKMVQNRDQCRAYELSSVRSVFTGGAPLGEGVALQLQELYPGITIRQAYGLTETSTAVAVTHHDDVWLGSTGVLLPGIRARFEDPEGNEITTHNTPGEMIVYSPSNTLGYMNNPKATGETFQDGWVRTGDEAVIRLSPSGNEHIFIIDRIKELIKVKGLQVAPAELEAHLLTHPLVADCAVIAVPHPVSGEVPRALIVRKPGAGVNERQAAESIQKYVSDHKARHKWLKGGLKFIDAIPRSPSGKILRRILRDAEKKEMRNAGAKI